MRRAVYVLMALLRAIDCKVRKWAWFAVTSPVSDVTIKGEYDCLHSIFFSQICLQLCILLLLFSELTSV